MTHRPPGRTQQRVRQTTWATCGLALLVGAGAFGRSRLRRFVVADRSMQPTLDPGQGLIGLRSNRASVGQLRCVEHPQQPDFWLVKRVTDLPTPTTMCVRSDNHAAATVDSRQFGPVVIDGTWRVVLRIPTRWM